MKIKSIIGLTILILIFISSILYYFHVNKLLTQQSYFESKASFKQSMHMTLNHLNSLKGTYSTNALQAWASESYTDHNLNKVWILNKQHKIVASNDKEHINTFSKNLPGRHEWKDHWFTEANSKLGIASIYESDNYFYGISKITLSNKEFYFIHKFDFNVKQTFIKKATQRSSLSILFTLFIFGVLFFTLFHRLTTKRIDRIIKSIHNKPNADLPELNTRGKDEIFELTEVLNETMRSLRSAHNEQFNKNLRYREMVENAVNIIVVIDEFGKITEANDALTNILGYTPDEIIGKNVALLTNMNVEEHDSYIHRYLKIGIAKIIGIGRDVDAQHKDGHTIPVHLSVSRFKQDGKNYFTGIITDLREKVQLENNLREAVSKAESALKVKDTFLSIMSHELRTPLNGILAPLNMLEMDVSDANRENLLQTAIRSTNRLTKLVDNILDYIQLNESFTLIEREAPLEPLITNTIHQIQELNDKNINLEIDLDLVGILVYCDSQKFTKVISCLVDNAYKFTEEGSIYVKADHRFESGKIHLTIYVKDSGIGVSSTQQKKIFTPFHQADASLTRKFEGAGLGLSIAQRYASMMGGNVYLKESKENSGSTFYFECTLNLLNNFKTIHETESKKVLIVEDNIINRKVVSKILTKLNVDFDTTKDGQEAVDKTIKTDYGLILMDLQMPIKDGFEATQEIFDQKSNHPPVIIALTANIENETQIRCKKLGMSEFLSKPIKIDVLKRVLKKYHIL